MCYKCPCLTLDDPEGHKGSKILDFVNMFNTMHDKHSITVTYCCIRTDVCPFN